MELDVQEKSRRAMIKSLVFGALSFAGADFKPASAFCGDPYPRWAYSVDFNDGVIPYEGQNLYLKVVGNERNEKKAKKQPLVVIPGGPGLSHDYLETIEAVAQTERRVILFDPLGTGQSSRTKKTLSVRSMVDQVNAIIRELGLTKYHMFAHGFGVPVALQKMKELKQTKNTGELVASVTLASPFEKASDLESRFQSNPSQPGTTFPWKQDADFLTNFITHSKDTPMCLEDSFKGGDSSSFFAITQSLDNWECASFMQYITCPVLITYGRYDVVPESSVLSFNDQIPANPQSMIMRFEQSGHLGHLSEREAYVKGLQSFLDDVDATSTGT